MEAVARLGAVTAWPSASSTCSLAQRLKQGTESAGLSLGASAGDVASRWSTASPLLSETRSSTHTLRRPAQRSLRVEGRGDRRSRRMLPDSCIRSWKAFLSRRQARAAQSDVAEASQRVATRGRRIVSTDRGGAAVTSEKPGAHAPKGSQGPAEAPCAQGRAVDASYLRHPQGQAQAQEEEGARVNSTRDNLQTFWLALVAALGRIDALGPAHLRRSWSVPWKGDTIFQVMFLWFMAFWFIGSWLIPVLTQLAGLNRASMSLRAQALYSLSTDLAEMAVGLSILNRCLSRFRPLSAEWFRFKPRGRWYMDALFACALFPVVQLLSRLNTSLIPVSLKFPPAVRIEQSINAQDPIATLIYATTVAFCAPVWEEVVFRGFLLPSLTRYLPLWGSITASAAIFSLAHFSLQRLLPLFFLGIVLGVVFARSQNLLSSILLHSLWNCFVFLDLLL